MSKKEHGKRINIVSIKLVKDSSIIYKPRCIDNPKSANELIKPFLAESDREKFIVICLDLKNQPTSINTISIGTVSSAIIHPREVFKVAILSNSSAIIASHNHPSGNPQPSQEDIQITKRLKEAGDILGIALLDHIIIGDNDKYVSLKEMEII